MGWSVHQELRYDASHRFRKEMKRRSNASTTLMKNTMPLLSYRKHTEAIENVDNLKG